MNKVSNLLWGLVLIVLGVIFGLNALDIADIDIFFDGWWTLFIIVPCFIGLFTGEGVTGNTIGIIIGICLLLACQGVLDFNVIWKLIVPVILIMVGLSIIFKDTINSKVKKEMAKANKGDKHFAATFSGQDLDFSNEDFNGCKLDAIFGGIECDLRDSRLDREVVIETCNVFGGTTIYVPTDVTVKVVSTSIFGGVSDDRKKKPKDCDKILYINATCIFGGVEIK